MQTLINNIWTKEDVIAGIYVIETDKAAENLDYSAEELESVIYKIGILDSENAYASYGFTLVSMENGKTNIFPKREFLRDYFNQIQVNFRIATHAEVRKVIDLQLTNISK